MLDLLVTQLLCFLILLFKLLELFSKVDEALGGVLDLLKDVWLALFDNAVKLFLAL